MGRIISKTTKMYHEVHVPARLDGWIYGDANRATGAKLYRLQVLGNNLAAQDYVDLETWEIWERKGQVMGLTVPWRLGLDSKRPLQAEF